MDNTREKLIVLISMVQDNGKRTECTENSIGVWSPSNAELADHLIANGVTLDNQVSSSKWISVKDRLPQDNERVLVYHDDGVIRFGINKDGFADVVSTLYLQNHHRTCFSKVTYWMPLPEPPKGE